MNDIRRPIATALRESGHRILVEAELISALPENAFNGWVTVQWDPDAQDWRLSPFVEDTRIDSVITVWRPLPDDTASPASLEPADRRGRLILALDSLMIEAEELGDAMTAYLIDRAIDQARSEQFRPPPAG